MSCLALLVLVSSHALAQTAVSRMQWHINATCAAGYQANWQNRMSIRAQSMSDGIRFQAEDYKAVAIRHYQEEQNSTRDEARQKIESYIAENVDRFIAMDKAGNLEPLLESCPEIEMLTPN